MNTCEFEVQYLSCRLSKSNLFSSQCDYTYRVILVAHLNWILWQLYVNIAFLHEVLEI